jgi:Ig-like domain CHU_C associated/PKD-like domain
MPFKVFFLTFFLTFFKPVGSLLNAQTSLVWYGTTDTVSALSVAGAIPAAAVQDAAGNIYTVGTLNNQIASPVPSQVDFDFGTGVQALNTITNNTNNDIFIAKYTAGGQLLWLKGIQGTANENAWDIALDINGNLLISGGYANFNGIPVDFDPGTGTAPMVPPILGWSAFVLKLDNNGNFVWVKTFNTTTTTGVNTFQARRIKTDAQGNVYTAGEFLVPVDFDPNAGTTVLTPVSNGTSASNAVDIFIQKMDASGNFIWANSIVADTTLRVLDLEIDPSGNPILAGIFQNQMDLDNTVGTNLVNTQTAQQNDVFLIKYASSTGTPIWTKTIGGTVNMDANLAVSSNLAKIGSLLTDAVGNIFLTSCFVNSTGGTIDFDPSPAVYGVSSPSNAGATPYVAKFSATGALLWAELYAIGGNARGGYGLALDNLGNVYMSGSLTANTGARFRTETGTSSYYTLTTNGSGLQAFTCKLNPLGRTIWVKAINSQNAGNILNQISATIDVFIHNNQIYNLGFVFATAAMGVQDFDPSAAISGRHTNSRNQMFIAKWCDMPGFITQTGVDSLICTYEETNLSMSQILGAGSYFWALPTGWSGSSNTNNIRATPFAGALANSVISVSVFTACGQTDAQTFPYTVASKPSAPIVLNATACAGDSLILTVQNPPATAVVDWFDRQPFNSTLYRGARFAAFQPVGGYNYYVYYTDSGCVSDYVHVQAQVITAPPAPVVSQSFSTVCEGNPLVLEMQPIAGASYLWREVSGAYKNPR